MTNKNHSIYGTNERLKELANEYRDYCGREVRLESDRLVVLALPSNKKPKKEKRSNAPRRESD